MVTHMHNEMKRPASEVRVGDSLIEGDGGLLDVVGVRRERGFLVFDLRSFGPTKQVSVRVRPSTLLRCFVVEGWS